MTIPHPRSLDCFRDSYRRWLSVFDKWRTQRIALLPAAILRFFLRYVRKRKDKKKTASDNALMQANPHVCSAKHDASRTCLLYLLLNSPSTVASIVRRIRRVLSFSFVLLSVLLRGTIGRSLVSSTCSARMLCLVQTGGERIEITVPSWIKHHE